MRNMNKCGNEEDEKIIDCAREAIETEIRGLDSLLKNSFNGDFVKLVKIILGLKGRVFLSAVGKPGYIARKAAASLSSTGTPAYFIHPTEASHGDLGMLTRDDMLILLSNSGDSSELNDLLVYCKRFGIELVGITRNANSLLAKSATLPLVLENVPQTNGINSPTTDTLMFMAYLDALTTVLIEQRHFGADDFKNFHPGGKLGSRLLRVRDVMRSGDAVPLVAMDSSVTEALEEMNRKNLGCVGILDKEGKLVGMLSDGDLRRKTIEYGNLLSKTLKELMTPNPKCVEEGRLAVEAVGGMTEEDRYRQILFVLDNASRVVGIVHIQDCFKARIV